MEKFRFLDCICKTNMLQEWLGLNKEQVNERMGEDVSRMVGFDQRNPHHCYTLFEHCLQAVDKIKLNNHYSKLLRVAGFFHDMGKPLVAREKAGRLVFYGHALKSQEMAKPILSNMGFTDEETELIGLWIVHHDDTINFTTDKFIHEKYGNPFLDENGVKNYILKNRESIRRQGLVDEREFYVGLFELCKADVRSQSKVVIMNGVETDTMERKLEKIYVLEELVLKNL